MSQILVIEIAREALLQVSLLAGPLLGVALAVGLAVSVVQTVTQIQEQTLSFVPKLIGVGMALLWGLSWMIRSLVGYTTELFRAIPTLGA